VQRVSRKPRSVVKIVLEVVYQLARNELARHHRYRAKKLKAPPKPPPSKRPVLQAEKSP
jgi:hypothetical protein